MGANLLYFIAVWSVSLNTMGQMSLGSDLTTIPSRAQHLIVQNSVFLDSHPCHPFSDIDYEKHQFFSPGYPADTYPNNTICTAVLRAPEGYMIKLDFRDWFELEESSNCKNDYLEIRDGSHGYNKILHEPFCGHTFPPVIISSDRYLWMQFRSDENIENRGFKAVFDFIKRPPGAPKTTPCQFERPFEEEGVIGNNDIPANLLNDLSTQEVPIDCVWNITTRNDWKIQLQFQTFSLEKINDCESNFVEIFSGDTTESSREKKFCGSIADTISSKHNTMFVRFYSEGKGNSSNFMANFTAFRDYNKALSGGKCAKDEFDCEDTTCIKANLKCNEKYNCKFRADEEGCMAVKSLGFSEDRIIIIMVIFSLILTGMCLTFIFNCAKKIIRDHQAIQEYIRQSREQQLNALDGDELLKQSFNYKMDNGASPSEQRSFERVGAPCYVPGGELVPILAPGEEPLRPVNEDMIGFNVPAMMETHQYSPDLPANMCDSACQTRESLLMKQESSEASPHRTVSFYAPEAGGEYEANSKYKAEAKIELGWRDQDSSRPYSYQSSKSAPDVIVTH